MCVFSFTEVNPDKGTETSFLLPAPSAGVCLQKLTPIRGRKLSVYKLRLKVLTELFTEVNPDKGTETLFLLIELSYLL